ncbi:hypothetical protein ACO2Q1_02855 [Brevundimonas sp. VNH65]|uniref:hypothetical protein n=1 Tax=Brevundimonas sp. VNH65 TaxID=3400917 RepID=UPI003C0A95C4
MLTMLLATLVLGAETVRVEVAPKFMNGVHMACEASFDVVVEDTAYYQGDAVAVAGSFSLYNWPDGSRVFVGMKLGVSRDGENYTAPSDAYVVNGFHTNLGEQQAQSPAESPRFRLFVFDAGGHQTVEALWGISFQNRLDVAYTLENGTVPMIFAVDFTPEHGEAWERCVSALTGRDA